MSDDHNDAKWLAVTFRWTRAENKRGWLVIRTCPCHRGERVTVHYLSKAQAEHARDILLSTEI